MNDIWNARRIRLEKAVIDAALDLFKHTGSVAFKVSIPNTRPEVFIIAGDQGTLQEEITE